jgi:hypothetical protein
MKTWFKIVLLVSAIFLYSCKCDKSVKLGVFKLTDASIQSVPYTGNETLIFEDNEGIEHRLTSRMGRELKEASMIVGTLCDEGTFDKQYQYYETQRDQVAYFDDLGKQIFYVNLTTQFEDKDEIDSIAIYDFLTVTSGINGENTGEIQIITAERQNHVSEFHKNEFWNVSDFIGDTLIFGEPFVDVYKSTTSQGNSIY